MDESAYLGIIPGVGYNSIAPDSPLIREQAAVMLTALKEKKFTKPGLYIDSEIKLRYIRDEIKQAEVNTMIQIRHVSDLRNRFPEIENAVSGGYPVFLTKNGYDARTCTVNSGCYSWLLSYICMGLPNRP